VNISEILTLLRNVEQDRLDPESQANLNEACAELEVWAEVLES
jgi:hypothetical protein